MTDHDGLVAGRVEQQGGRRGAEELGQRPPGPFRGEHSFDVARAADHPLVFRIRDQQEAVRLDRSRNMDRLTVADGQVRTEIRGVGILARIQGRVGRPGGTQLRHAFIR